MGGDGGGSKGLGDWGGEGGGAGGLGGVGGSGDIGGLGGGDGGLGGSGGAAGAGTTLVVIVAAVTLRTTIPNVADAAARLVTTGSSLLTSFAAASGDGDEMVAVTTKLPATTVIDMSDSLTPSIEARAVFSPDTS